MKFEDFEKYLKEKGGYYYRANITVHFSKNEETGERIFWGNYKGEETKDFSSLKDLMAAHSWVEIPEKIEDESFPMMRNLPNFINHKIIWQGIEVNITHKPKYFQLVSHIEVHCNEVLPITETGYRSIFLPPEVIEQEGGAINIVMQMLEAAALSKEWQHFQEASKQNSLF